MILSINMRNSNNLNKFELASSHARVTSIKFTKQQSVSESVSQSLTSIPNDWPSFIKQLVSFTAIKSTKQESVS